MCKTDRESYEKYWDDISPFIKFGCLKDEKFCEKMYDYILFKDLDSKYLTLTDYIKSNTENTDDAQVVESTETSEENTSADQEEKKKKIVYYVSDEQQQSQYINMFKEAGLNAVILTHNIDSPFVTQLEQKNEDVKFQRIDADLTDTFKEDIDVEAMKEDADTLTEVFRKALSNDKLDVKVEKLKNESISSMITLSEESRRMQDMMKMYNMYGMDPSMFGTSETLVLNANNSLVKYILENKDSQHVPMMCEQLYDLALICHKPLSGDAMTKFIARSNEIMMLLAK